MSDPSVPGPQGKLNPLHLQLRAHTEPRQWWSSGADVRSPTPTCPARRPKIRANTLPLSLQQRPWRKTSKTATSHSPRHGASKKTCWLPGKEHTMEHFREKMRGSLLRTGRHCCSFHQPIQTHHCSNKLLQMSTHMASDSMCACMHMHMHASCTQSFLQESYYFHHIDLPQSMCNLIIKTWDQMLGLPFFREE